MLRTKAEKSYSDGPNGKESACSVGDLGSIPELGRSPGRDHGNPFQYSCLDTPQPTPRAGSPALRRSGNHLGEGPARAPSPQPPSTDPGLRCAQECGGPGIGRELEASPQPASWCPGIALLLK